jgi:hypothetical protein
MNLRDISWKAVGFFALLCMVVCAFAADRKPVPVPSAPTEKTYKSLRGVQYCEVWLFVPTAEKNIDVDYYNTSSLNNSANTKDTCPADMWSKVSDETLKASYDIGMSFKNGPRGWTMDWIRIPVGPVVDFDGLKARWWGKGVLPPTMANLKPGELAYKSLQSHRKSSMTFEKGKPVFILDDPEGTPWVMQAYSAFVDTTLTYDTLKDLGGKLKPPAGWKYRAVTLDKDLTISTPQGYNWITQDDLQNTYDACKEGACNFKP